MKLPSIDGREIVPVRFIPFISSDIFGQETLAGILAHKLRANGFPLLQKYTEVTVDGESTEILTSKLIGHHPRHFEVYAYHLTEFNKVEKMLATEWDRIVLRISTLEPKFRKQEEVSGIHNEKFHEWYVESLKLLPAGVFLWKSDFEALWDSYLGQSLPLPSSRPDERKINYGAYLGPEFIKIVEEGFDELLKASSAIIPEESEETPEEFVARRLEERFRPEQIAVELRAKGMSYQKIGKLLCDDGTHVEFGTIKKRGQRLVDKGHTMKRK